MALDIESLPVLFEHWRTRYADRDARFATIDAVVRGEFDVVDQDEEQIENRSPNMIQVALEDTAEAASLIPTIRVQPGSGSQTDRDAAAGMEKIGVGYFDTNDIELLIPRFVMDEAAYGLSVATVTPDLKEKRVLIERRDPRHCFPEPGYRPGDVVRKALFARAVYFTQLPDEYRSKIRAAHDGANFEEAFDENAQCVLIEFYDDKEIVVAAIYESQGNSFVGSQEVHQLPVELDRTENKVGVCPVVIGSRITLDGEFRGQFDQVVGMMNAHIQLMGLVIDYADQAVYSDVWVRDLIGEMPWGGGAYIELGPQGAIGRVPPAVNSLNVQQDLEQLINGIHLGGRYPKSRPGEVDQSIASAKFLEASAGVMNTAIRTYHQTLQKKFERILRIAFETDRLFFAGKRHSRGILRNQTFLHDYDPAKDIDLKHQVRVEYGLGLGRDPAQSAVLHIQYAQNGYISDEFVQENIDGLTDVARERVRIDLKQFRAMALAKLLQGLEMGSIPDSALVEIARARANNEDLFDLYEQYVVQPAEEQAAQMVETGLPGQPPMMPGAPEAPMGPPPPAAPGGSDLLARLNTPAGPGGTLGAQTLVEGA